MGAMAVAVGVLAVAHEVDQADAVEIGIGGVDAGVDHIGPHAGHGACAIAGQGVALAGLGFGDAPGHDLWHGGRRPPFGGTGANAINLLGLDPLDRRVALQLLQLGLLQTHRHALEDAAKGCIGTHTIAALDRLHVAEHLLAQVGPALRILGRTVITHRTRLDLRQGTFLETDHIGLVTEVGAIPLSLYAHGTGHQGNPDKKSIFVHDSSTKVSIVILGIFVIAVKTVSRHSR